MLIIQANEAKPKLSFLKTKTSYNNRQLFSEPILNTQQTPVVGYPPSIQKEPKKVI